MQAIVAVSKNWGIGRDGQLLFRLSGDLQRFKAITSGHTVVMGRKTLQSLPSGKGLPNRRNLVLTHDPSFSAQRAEFVYSSEDLLAQAGEDAFCIGGGELYRLLLPYCTRVYVTKVLEAPQADTFFPNLDEDPSWHIVSQSEPVCEDGIQYIFVDYERK